MTILQNGKPIQPRKDLPKEKDYSLEQNGKKITHKVKAKDIKPYAIHQNGRHKYGKLDPNQKAPVSAKVKQERHEPEGWDQEKFLAFVIQHNDTTAKDLKKLLFKALNDKITPEEARAVKEECAIRSPKIIL